MVQAIVFWIVAAAIVACPFLFPEVVLDVLPGQPDTLPTWVYGVFGAVAAFFGLQGFWALKRSRPKKQTSEGSNIMAAVLLPLERQGWKIAYGTQIKGVGRIDAFIRSPKGKVYLIDMKSHRGKIGTDGKTIFRVYDQSTRPFEQDFLAQTQQRAQAVQLAQKLSTVTPLLIFPEAIVEVDQNPIAGVYVVGRTTLRSCLLQLG